jgi:hypothetical protein
MPAVRLLNEEGIGRFREFITSLRSGAQEAVPRDLLSDPDASVLAEGAAEVEVRDFVNKAEFAEYLVSRIEGQLPGQQIDYHRGLWSWIALFYFDQLCPADTDGVRHPLREDVYVPPSVDAPFAFRSYYRHLAAGPYRMRLLYPDHAAALLWAPVHQHPDLLEQLAAYQYLVTNRGYVNAYVRLYFRNRRGRLVPKTGATTRTRPGNVRRLRDLADQLDRTCDLYGLTGDQFLALLPPEEYAEWRQTA